MHEAILELLVDITTLRLYDALSDICPIYSTARATNLMKFAQFSVIFGELPVTNHTQSCESFPFKRLHHTKTFMRWRQGRNSSRHSWNQPGCGVCHHCFLTRISTPTCFVVGLRKKSCAGFSSLCKFSS